MDFIFFYSALTWYVVGLVFYWVYAIGKNETISRAGWICLVLGILLHASSLSIRLVMGRQLPDHSWYVPWSNWFESFSLFALVIGIEYLILQWREHRPVLGAFVLPVMLLIMGGAIASPFGTQIPSVPEKWHSVWMWVHVPVVMVAYGGFTLAFVVGHAFLLQERQIKSKKPSPLMFRLPSLDGLEQLIFKIIRMSWPMLILGIFLGFFWSVEINGTWWQGTAKETWSILTLFVYTVYLFFRGVMGWRGRKATYLSLVGFVVALTTFIGANYFSRFEELFNKGVH